MRRTAEGWEIRITEMDLFTGLDLTVMGEIADKACQEATFDEGSVIFNQGDAATDLYVLEEGVVLLTVGKARTVYSLSDRSDIFGWSSLIEHATYTATAVANTNVQAIRIDSRKMNRLFDSHSKFGLTVYRRLAAVFNKRLASIYARYLSL
ncbi:MAG: cyclic nucleotide-binding domain-containing protein [Desulfosarcinaceae bacterium]|nr:cyclic nucleotide-binding domain-containing protein [Desulfosarcinaceae bacterium]